MSTQIFLYSVILSAALTGPFIWADRKAKQSLFYAALSMLFALGSFGAIVSQEFTTSASILNFLSAAEVIFMVMTAPFIYNALSLAATDRNSITPFFGAAAFLAVILLSLTIPTFDTSSLTPAASIFWTACTIAGLVKFRRKQGRFFGAIKVFHPVVALGAGFTVIHFAQLLRIAWSFPNEDVLILQVTPAVLSGFTVLAAIQLSHVFLPGPPRYAKSGTSTGEVEEIFCSIEKMMRNEKLFRDPDLDRERLSALIEASPREVGEAINRAAGKTLPAYLREWRVREADRLLQMPDNETTSLEALGMEAGFRSRSSFYTAFRQTYGETPGERRIRLVKLSQ